MVCVDIFFVNQDWLTLFLNSFIFNYPRIMSDYSLICLDNEISSFSLVSI
jgi:hypothetical protein